MAGATRMPVTSSVAFIYPRLFSLRDLPESVGALDTDGSPHLPSPMPLLLEKLEADGAYLLEDSGQMFLWLGKGVPQQFLEDVLQVRDVKGLDCSRLRVFPCDSGDSVRPGDVHF